MNDQLDIFSIATFPANPTRRIDITLARIADIYEQLPDEDRERIGGEKWWNIIVIVFRIRAMERGEEEVTGHSSRGLADAYDRIALQGEPAHEAILRTFKEVYAPP